MEVLRDIGPYLGLAVVLILATVFFSGTEVALFALRRTEREQMSRSKRRTDQIVLGLLATPRKLIATVLIGNELAGATIAAICVLALGRASELEDLPRAAVALAIAIPVIVLVGAVTAKTLALKAPMGWARFAAPVLQALGVLIAPARWIVSGLAEALMWPLGAAGRARPERDLSEEEFRKLVDAGSAQGQVDARERRIIHRVFEFGDKTVGQVMTPRDKMVALSYDLPMQRMVKEASARGFSRIPIYQRSLDNVRGVLNTKDLIRVTAGHAPPRALGELLHEALFVPRTTPIKRLFRIFKQKKVHLAIVVNEYGKVLGLVTMDDLLAQLFGQFRDEREAVQRAASGRSPDRTPVPGSAPSVPHPLHVETGPVGKVDAASLAETGLADRADLTPTGDDDPIAQVSRLHSLSSLEDDRTPAPVDLIDVIARASDIIGAADEAEPDDDAEGDGTPVPVTESNTGPSGPVAAARRGGDS